MRIANSGLLNEPKLGIALGSGNVSGFANIGVLKALVREQIPIDIVRGLSAGSIVVALFAAGIPIKELEERDLSVWRSASRALFHR